MDNSDKIILDLCGGSGSWSRPYREAGYTVVVVTLPQFDVTQTYMGRSMLHNNAPILAFRNHPSNNEEWSYRVDEIYGILAAPPCTEFSPLRNFTGDRCADDGYAVVDACEAIIRYCIRHGNLRFWALENPRGELRKYLGNPAMTFQPWQYGDAWTKTTDIWGYFTRPKPFVKAYEDLQELSVYKRPGRGKTAINWLHKSAIDDIPQLAWAKSAIETDADLRSITPPGFARAFFKANK